MLKIVHENLILFQYVLGPDVTPDGLLEYLIDPSKNILKDYTLAGIILGFGVQNSLYYRRLELIQKGLWSKEKAPFKAKYERLNIPDSFNGLYMGFDLYSEVEEIPSFNHASLANEYLHLFKTSSSSLKKFNQRLCNIALFHF